MHIYWFQDSKIGHLNQVQALLDEMAKEIDYSITKIYCQDRKILHWFHPYPAPDAIEGSEHELMLLIGAGHSTYPSMLKTQKLFKKTKSVISVAILKPSFNSNAFDLICAPEHDYPSQRKDQNIYTFKGSLAPVSSVEPTKNKAMIAIGGLSKHYVFDVELVEKQIKYILATHPEHHFHVFNSRRTPESLNTKIVCMSDAFTNFNFIDVGNTLALSFQDALRASEIKFVTPDSSNLVFESLSSKGKTYLMQIEDLERFRIFSSKKIRKVMASLEASGQVGTVSVGAPTKGLKVHKIQHPSVHAEPLAEVKNTACAVLSLLKERR
jgi:mitochondrial fission protein ELM1